MPASLQPVSILALDDDPAMQALYPVAFRNLPVAFSSAESESEAEVHLQSHAPDLLLLDLRLGSSNGLEVAERLFEKTKRVIPTVIVTAEARRSHEHLGPDKYLGVMDKPICLTTFGRDVLSHLDTGKGHLKNENLPAVRAPEHLAKAFLQTALATARALSARCDSDLLSDDLLAQAAHRWIGVSGMDFLPHIATEARELERLARLRSFEQIPAIRYLLEMIDAQFESAFEELPHPMESYSKA